MKTLRGRNVHQIIPYAIDLMREIGRKRDSRNGPVFVAPEPVSTEYLYPTERVIFWPERDANPFLHLYESLWMLSGRRDIAPLLKYTKQFLQYSDNGKDQHGAYGFRWAHHFGVNQIPKIIKRLKEDPLDRRSVLTMWDPIDDLDMPRKDVPCNLVATFQVDLDGRLNLVVFCRSNDIVWGAYGANAVHFSMLLEYMARAIEAPVGTYTQVSVNWHAYENTWELFDKIPHAAVKLWDPNFHLWDPYETREARVVPMPEFGLLKNLIALIVHEADHDFNRDVDPMGHWGDMVYHVLKAHHLYSTLAAPERHARALQELSRPNVPQDADWVIAARQWIQRRQAKWQSKMEGR